MLRKPSFAPLALFAFLAVSATAAELIPDPNNLTGSTGLILIDKLGHRVRFFDPVTHQEISSLDPGVNPHDVAISPDRKTAYVPIYGDGVYGNNQHPGHTIAIIDLATRQMTGAIDVSPYQAPHDIKVDRSGILYVVCDLSRKLLVIDPQTRALKAAIDTEGTGHWFTVLPDGSKAYVASKNDQLFVSVIDLKAGKMTTEVHVPNGTQGIAASPDGKYVFALDFSQPLIWVIATIDDSLVDKLTLQQTSKAGYIVRFTPDGSKMLVCSIGNSQVNIFDAADLQGKQQVLKVGKDPMGFAFAPDGRIALVANHGDGTVSVIDLQEGRVTGGFMAGTGIESASYY